LQDSLQAGMSRFYAEINRIKQLMEMAAGGRPLLFLLEEVLAGTNSRTGRRARNCSSANSSVAARSAS